MPEGADFDILVGPPATSFIHAATPGNTGGHHTTISNALIDGNPNARFLVTQNWNGGGSSGVYNDHTIGVYYTTGGAWRIFNQDIAAMPVGADFNIVLPPPSSHSFVHTVATGTTGNHTTAISHPLLDGNPYAVPHVTQNWNPPGTIGVNNDNEVGLYYGGGALWHLVNQNTVDLPAGASFNIVIPPRSSAGFVHTATAGNTLGYTTDISHPLLNDNPNAIVQVTQNWNAGGGPGVSNASTIGLYYSGGWQIFNQDFLDMPEGADFNLLLQAVDLRTFVHHATPDNISSHVTKISHPLLDGNASAIFQVSQNWNAGLSTGVYNDSTIGIFYTGSEWRILNQDFAAMPEGADFNISITPSELSFVHTATPANISGHVTTISHPLLDGIPNAIAQVTQNWNAGGGPGVFNDNEVGIYYSGDLWRIFNQNLVAMPEGAHFNISVIPDIFSDGLESGDTSAWLETP